MKAELQSKFQFKLEWRKGKDHAIADCLSRAPVDDPDEAVDDLHVHTVMAVQIASSRDGKLDDNGKTVDVMIEELRAAARGDADYMRLLDAVKNDSIGNENAPACVKQFKAIRHALSIDNDLVLYGQRLVIPKAQRKSVLERLHSAHQGITRTKQRARMCVYWPGLTNDITLLIENCEACQ